MRAILPALLLLAGTALQSCHDVDSDRIPLMPVRIQFATQGDWHTYGISGALTAQRFIRGTGGSNGIPLGFPYTALSATGYGGVLLVGTYSYSGNPTATPPAAYDLACPVEARPATRIEVDYNAGCARCPECGSTYDIFQGYGMPLSGPASRLKYGLRRYTAAPGLASEYLLITN